MIPEPNVTPRHHQEQITACKSSRMRWAHSDSGNSSADNFDEYTQNGDAFDPSEQLSTSENKVCELINSDHVQNTSSCENNVYNDIRIEMTTMGSSSSNCNGSSNGFHNKLPKSVQQIPVDLFCSQSHRDNLWSAPQKTLASCENGKSETHNRSLETNSTSIYEGTNAANICESPTVNTNSHNGHVNVHGKISVDHTQSATANNSTELVKVSTNNSNSEHIKVSRDSNNSDHVKVLAHQPRALFFNEVQTRSCEDAGISPPIIGLHYNNTTQSRSAPSPPTKMADYCHAFMSLPVSPMDLVPKHIMDSLARELERERSKVETLQEERNRLYMKVAELENKRSINDVQKAKWIYLYKQEMSVAVHLSYQQNVSFLMQWGKVWKEKFERKDKELVTLQKDLNDLHIKYRELENQNSVLNVTLCSEISASKKLNDSFCNVTKTLEKERARFGRDEKCFRKKIDDLRQKLQWVREELSEYQKNPTPVTSSYDTDSLRLHQETQLKGVYPENTECLAQGAYPKKIHKKSRDHQFLNSSPNLDSLAARDKCQNCYKEPSDFTSYEDFKSHKEKCEL